MKFRTDFLFPETDFLTGAGSVFNIAGNYFRFAASKDENIADFKAIRSDWGMVGQDLYNVIAKTDTSIVPEEELICQ